MIDLARAHLDWHRLDLGPLVVEVTADALVIDGSRPSFTPVEAQRIADELGACLLTPQLADEIWLRADARLTPHWQPVTKVEAPCPDCGGKRQVPWARCQPCCVLEHSRQVDAELATLAATGKLPADRPALLGTVGKPWALAAGCFTGLPGKPYGWMVDGPVEHHGGMHWWQSPIGAIPVEPSATGCCWVVQPLYIRGGHGPGQLDGFEPWRGWRPVGLAFADVWRDYLGTVCHDRPPSWRLPGVPLP